LEKVTQEITSGINDVAIEAESINAAANYIREISGKNREAISLLEQEVSRFKVE
jgi:methyl-accepting chemotaxis protein